MNPANFARAIGVDPATVVNGSMEIKVDQQGNTVLSYSAVVPIPPHVLGAAMMQASDIPKVKEDDGEGAVDEPEAEPEHAEPEPAKKAVPAKKTAAKRASR